MKAINFIIAFGAFAAAVLAANVCAAAANYGLTCGDIRIAVAGWCGMIWFGALAVKFAFWGVCPGPQKKGE